jgi:hypothetical protein
MKLVYVAGPYTAATPWEVEQNIRRAEEVGLSVARLGRMPVIPHSMCRFFHGQQTSEFWYEGTLMLLSKCDEIILVDGWTKSKGTLADIEHAAKLGIQRVELLYIEIGRASCRERV